MLRSARNHNSESLQPGKTYNIKLASDIFIFLLAEYLVVFPILPEVKYVFSSNLAVLQAILPLLSNFFALFSSSKHRLILLPPQ